MSLKLLYFKSLITMTDAHSAMTDSTTPDVAEVERKRQIKLENLTRARAKASEMRAEKKRLRDGSTAEVTVEDIESTPVVVADEAPVIPIDVVKPKRAYNKKPKLDVVADAKVDVVKDATIPVTSDELPPDIIRKMPRAKPRKQTADTIKRGPPTYPISSPVTPIASPTMYTPTTSPPAPEIVRKVRKQRVAVVPKSPPPPDSPPPPFVQGNDGNYYILR